MLLDNVARLARLKGSLDAAKHLNLHLLLRFDRLGSHVRQQDALIHLDESLVDLWLRGVNIETCTAELSAVESLNESLLVDHTTAGGVYEDGAILHLIELGLAE